MAMAAADKKTVQLRVICMNRPEESSDQQPQVFGLQDKTRAVHPGAAQGDGSLVFQCELQVQKQQDGTPNFSGTFAHGTPAKRFLYLALKHDQKIIRRLKIHLSSITWEQIAGLHSDKVLEVHVDGRGTASVPLLGEGWIITSK
ncbi:MAG: DUF5990 family protein [Anaerolineae bacterium]|nr:DUF5990 family protein [Anaerolineae bacterium]